jgi:hypothetical protein
LPSIIGANALRHLIVAMTFLAGACSANGEAASCALAASSPAPAPDAVQAASEWARAKGWREGFDRNSRRLVVLASAGFQALPSPAAYVAARQAAFDSAMADARKQAAEFLGAEVSSSVRSRTSLQEVIGDPAVAEALTGIASDEAFRSSAELEQAVSVAARASIAGIYACQTFESSDGAGAARIAVVAAVSPDSAAAVRGGKSGDCDHQGIDGWLRSVDDASLARTFGIRFAYDGQCFLRPVSFGQAAVRPGSLGMDAAVSVAKETAIRQLNEALGEAVASRTLSESLSRSDEGSGVPPAFRSLETFEGSIASASRSNFGPEVVGRRTVKDADSGAQLVVVAVSIASTSPAASGAAAAPGGAAPKGAAPAVGGCPPVPEQMAASIRQTRASGTGPTKSAALETALFEAVRREGTIVKGNSLLERQFSEAIESVGNEVREKASSRLNQSSTVQTYANGFVHSYEVLRETDEGGLWEVEVCANLVRFDPKNPRFGLPPTVAVMPMSCTAQNVKVAGAPVACEEATAPCEQALDEALGASGSFMVLAERDMRDLGVVRADIARRVGSGRSEEMEALKLGRELTADFVVLGKVTRAEFTGSAGQRPQDVKASDMAVATVSARMVNVASGEVAWSKDATVTLKGRDILLVRAGRELKDPAEAALSPMQLAVSRAAREITDALAKAFPPKASAAAAVRAKAPADAPIRIVRVAGGMVTLDAANPAVAVGARFVINLLVDVALPGGRTEIDRDRLATVEVVSVSGALAKARVVDGDASAIDPAKCEAVPEQRSR